ncbi:MAG: polysaccharide deacetylase family protein [Treponema sp.]|nr:polysaccharide deacetylase family protein [Treponema sp.]
MKRIGDFFLILFFVIVYLNLGACKSINTKPREFPSGIVTFSFDDGPNVYDDTTLRLLEVLEKYGIRACFSLLGINAEQNPAMVRRIAAGGHRIINHGYGESWAFFLNNEAFSANILAGEKAILAALGEQEQAASVLPAYRPHGGYYKRGQRQFWEQQGYRMAPCTIRIYDAVLSGVDRDKAIARIIEKVEKEKGGIILLHDARDAYTTMEKQLALDPEGSYNRSWLPSAVEEIIIILLEKGYRISGFDPAEIPGVLQ